MVSRGEDTGCYRRRDEAQAAIVHIGGGTSLRVAYWWLWGGAREWNMLCGASMLWPSTRAPWMPAGVSLLSPGKCISVSAMHSRSIVDVM